MIDGFHDQDVKVMLWTVSGINDDAGDIYQEGIDQNYFLRASAEDNASTTSWWKGDGRTIDYFNPEAVPGGMGSSIKPWQWGSMADAMAWIMNVGGWYRDPTTYSPALGRDVTGTGCPLPGLLLLHA